VKVLAVTNMYPTSTEPWFGSFVRDQIEDLRILGVDVDILSFDGRADNREYVRAAGALRDRLRTHRYDLVHAHYGLTGAVALLQRRTRVITTFWGTDAGYVPWKRRVSWFVSRLAEPIFVSRAAARTVGLPHARVIPTGVDTTLFRPGSRVEARRQLGWAGDRAHVLLPGARRLPVKNAVLFDAALTEVGPEVTPQSLEGYTREEAALVLRAADAVLMTSLSEGSPVAVKEALASGTPVVSVDVGDVAEVVDGLPGCSIRRRDARDLARGVIDALATSAPEALRARAEDFARPLIARRVADVYAEVAA
jgi:glycosyltransferase involved in cell wall biosynthesis